MKTGRIVGSVLLISAVVGLCGGAARAQNVGGAYDRLPTDRLIKQLSFLGMTEMLQALEQEIPATDKSVWAMALRGRIRIGLANAMADPEDRNRLLDQAIPLLTEAVKLSDKIAKPTPAQTLDIYRFTMELAVAMGRYRVENPHVLRLRHLQGGQADLQVLRKYTKEAVDYVDLLKDDVSDTLTDWRPNMELLMIWVPKLEDLQVELKYNAAWIRLHRAMAIDPGAERVQLCRDITNEMKPFTTDADSGVMYWALYVTGIAHRLSKEHDKADAILGKAAVPEASSKDLRQRAWFERARNRIEEGDVPKAEKAIQDFETGSLAIWGPEKRVMVDLRVVLLKNYLYEMLAGKTKDNAEAGEFRAKAQEVLLSFVEKHADRPDLVKAFLDIVATKFAHVKDLDSANAIVLLARAYTKIESKEPADQAEAERLLTMVLAHKDLRSEKIAKSIRPGVLWELAFLKNKTKQNVDAAKYFVALSRLHPKHSLALRSAKFAVQSLYAVFEERLTKGKAIKPNLRMAYIHAIDTLLSGWPEAEGVGKWNFDLAGQCMQLAGGTRSRAIRLYWQGRAVAGFEKVPSDLLEYMEAQHSALALRTEIVLGRDELAELVKKDNATAREQLRQLAGELLAAERVRLAPPAGAATQPATTAPATAPAGEPEESGTPEGDITRRAEALHKLLAESLQQYSDPKALTARLKTYSGEASKESNEVAGKAKTASGKEQKDLEAIATGLREWAAQADFQAAVIKYEQLPRGMKPQAREAIEKEALEDLRRIIEKWPGTSILQGAYEFEIRKLIERGQTAEAIDKIGAFKKVYPEQARGLIGLVVAQIQEQIRKIGRRLQDARTATEADTFQTELRKYQLDYARFAEDLYNAVKDLPVDLAPLVEKRIEAESLEKARSFDGLVKLAGSFGALAAQCRVEPKDIKAAGVLDAVLAEAKKPGANKTEILPNLAGALINAVIALRDVVDERYARHQMYGDSMLEKGKAEEVRRETLEAKGAFQAGLAVFLGCYEVDEAKRKVQADHLEKLFAPRIAAVKTRGKSMDALEPMVAAYKKEFIAAGGDPNDSADVNTLRFALDFLRKAKNPQQEARRLPRVVNLLTKAWENLLGRQKNRLIVDHVNIIGLARAYLGLRQYEKAIEFFRKYTDGFPENRQNNVFYWRAQLERCQCQFEGYQKNPEAMKNLVIHINMLQLKDKTMGGFAPEFERIKRAAAKIAKKAKPRKRARIGAGD